MNGLEERNRTLGELRTELRGRLGFVQSGPAASGNTPILNSFLQEGHDFLYDELKPSPARKKAIIRLMPGQHLYDYHNDKEDEPIDPGTVSKVWLELDGNNISTLAQGIAPHLRAFESRSYPTRYDTLNGQMELWPVPSQQYDLYIEYLAPKPRFTQDQDRPGVPDRLVFLYALANAKAHYRQPDAQAAGATFTKMLATAKARQHENRRYVMATGKEEARQAQVVQTANGFKSIG